MCHALSLVSPYGGHAHKKYCIVYKFNLHRSAQYTPSLSYSSGSQMQCNATIVEIFVPNSIEIEIENGIVDREKSCEKEMCKVKKVPSLRAQISRYHPTLFTFTSLNILQLVFSFLETLVCSIIYSK